MVVGSLVYDLVQRGDDLVLMLDDYHVNPPARMTAGS